MRARPLVTTLAAVLLTAVAAPAQTTFQLHPRGAYLRANNDSTVDPLIVELSPLGLVPGDTIRLEILGPFQFSNNPADQSYSAGGVFSATSIILPQSLQYRVPGAIDAGKPWETPPTYFGGLATDIPEDFIISPGSQGQADVTIPPGSAFLFISPVDSYYADNSDPDSDYRVRIARLCNATGCNLADIVGIGGAAGPGGLACPDGLLTGDDFNAFIAAFAAGEPLADITGIGGPPELPDGLITGDDFNAFIGAFATGCP